MQEVHIYVKTNKSGSESCAGSTGYTREEWDNLSEQEKIDITNELIWNAIDVREKDE